MKNKALAVMLAAAMALSLTACGNSEETTSVSGTETSVSTSETSAVEEEEEQGEGLLTLGEYKGITVYVDKTEISDDMLDQYVEYFYQQAANELDWHKTAEEGDTVVIDYVGTMDGEEFDGGSSDDYFLTLGSDTFIDGFEDGLIGIAKGESRDLELTFPSDYSNTDLAGKAVVFAVTCDNVIPPMTDENIAALQDDDYSNVEEYRAHAKSVVDAYYEQDYDTDVISAALDEIMTNSTFGSMPEDRMTEMRATVESQYTSAAEKYGMELAEYFAAFGTTEDEVASIYVKRDLVFEAIAEAEGFSYTDEEVDAWVQEQIDASDVSENLEETYERESRDEYREYLVLQDVYDYLIANTIVKPTSEEPAEDTTSTSTSAE